MTLPTQPTQNWERIAVRFQQRIAETVAKYEADIILLQEDKENLSAALNQANAELQALREEQTQNALDKS